MLTGVPAAAMPFSTSAMKAATFGSESKSFIRNRTLVWAATLARVHRMNSSDIVAIAILRIFTVSLLTIL